MDVGSGSIQPIDTHRHEDTHPHVSLGGLVRARGLKKVSAEFTRRAATFIMFIRSLEQDLVRPEIEMCGNENETAAAVGATVATQQG